MMRSRICVWTLIANTSGVTAIEYGLIAALIAVAAVVVMGTVGTNLSGVFSQVAAASRNRLHIAGGVHQSPLF
jgi:pilus assembly protein Flp/PilA